MTSRLLSWTGLAVATCAMACREPSPERGAPPPARDAAAAPAARPAAAADATPAAAAPAPNVTPAVSAALAAEPPPDTVPAELVPWLSWADAPVTASDPAGTRPVVEGDVVLPGTVVTLPPGAPAAIDLPDGSVLAIDELTELLVREVELRGGIRRIELTVFDGAVRVTVPVSPEAGSSFRLATPVGVVELAGGEVAVDVDGRTGAARVVDFDGTAVVQAGAHRLELHGVPDQPAGAQVAPDSAVRAWTPEAEQVERWRNWDDRFADRLIVRYGVDIGAPGEIDASALSVAAHPVWAATIAFRRARIAARAADLARSLGPAGLAGSADPRTRHALARDMWGAATDNGRMAVAEASRDERLRGWTAREATRAERLAALAPTLARLREAWTPPPTPSPVPSPAP